MADDYVARRQQLKQGWSELTDALPGVMDSMGRLHRTAISDGVLSGKVKELMALSIAVAIHCDGCIAYHVHGALRAGASPEEIEEALGVAILMGGGPAAICATDARRAVAQLSADRARR